MAQTPPKLEPLPDVPAPPPVIANDPNPETPVTTTTQREDNVVEETRVRGELRYIKVTPRHGRAYYLIPDSNGTTYIRRDSLDPTLKVPMWVLFSF